MAVLGVLLPVGLIGLITWIVVGVRRRADEPFTVAAATSFYANLFTIVSVTLVLLGLATAAKAVIGFFDIGYSYRNPLQVASSTPLGATAGSSDLTPQRTDDIALAATLVGAGVLLFLLHRLVARVARRHPGGMPSWVKRGTLLGFTVLYASAAIFALIAAVDGIVTYVITPPDGGVESALLGPGPFGDVVGTAVVFIPAWILALMMLLRRMRSPAPQPPPVT